MPVPQLRWMRAVPCGSLCMEEGLAGPEQDSVCLVALQKVVSRLNLETWVVGIHQLPWIFIPKECKDIKSQWSFDVRMMVLHLCHEMVGCPH